MGDKRLGSRAVIRPETNFDDALRAELRAVGLRATASRLGVLRLLRAAGRPVSHADMETLAAGESWNRTTLYRNLLDLVRVGYARRFDLGDHVWRFEAVEAAPKEAHPHFVCNSCGTVECLPDVAVAIEPGPAPRAVREKSVEVQLRGVCDRCD